MTADDEIRAAAEVILATPSTGRAWAAEPGKLIPLARNVARAYLAGPRWHDAPPVPGRYVRERFPYPAEIWFFKAAV